ncbi:ATPase family associated with various cellular activities (AAA) domain-containing protein [Ditylenchus destructor]|nr:ATPase family associated with various cellular activities (AAA) domain-containing protein [Ditylenchus destructor]
MDYIALKHFEGEDLGWGPVREEMARVIDVPPQGWIQSVTKLFSNSSIDCAHLNTRQLGLSHAAFIKAIKPNSEENQQKEFVFKVKHNDRVPFDAIGLEPSTRRWTGIELSEVIFLEPIIFGDNAIAQITMELGFASKADETDSALLCSSSIAREFRHLFLDTPLNVGQEVIFDFSGSNSRKRTAEQAFGLGYGALSPFTKTARVKLVASVKQIELRCKEGDKANGSCAFGLLKDDSYVLLCPAPGSIIKLHGTNQISQWKPAEDKKPVEETPKQDEQPNSPAKSTVTACDDSSESAEKKPEATPDSTTTAAAKTTAVVTTTETSQKPIELEAVELPDSSTKTYYTCDLVLNVTDYDITKNGAHVCIDYTIADGTQKQFFATAKNDDKSVKKGDVAMGSLHLKFTKIEVGQKVKVRAILEDEKKCKIEWMQAEAKLDSSSLCSLFDSTQLADKYKSVFANRFVNKDQSLACILSSFTRPKQSLFSESSSESYTFSFTPKEIRLKNTTNSTDVCTCVCGAKKEAENSKVIETSQFGLFTRETKIELISADSNKLDFYGDCYKKDDKIQPILKPDWDFSKMGIGGLDEQFGEIFRRAFASRMLPESVRNEMGIIHTRGILLYGPPGTGKTLIARKIAGVLNAREPKIVRGPEIFSKWVGDSEKNIRELFSDAEGEYAALGEKSRLHVIIFDEFDAVCPNREFCNSGHRIEQKVVNQLLSAIDGVDQLNNILVIAMTNQKDQIDPAILRPGRIEIQIEIHLPDEAGRLQILNIHTEKMRENKRLDESAKLDELAKITANFSGAELEGLVRAAQSCALSRFVTVQNCSAENLEKEATDKLKITMADFEAALEKDVKPVGYLGNL